MKTNQLQRIIRTGRTGHWLNHGKEHCLVSLMPSDALLRQQKRDSELLMSSASLQVGVKGNTQGFNRGLDCDVIVAEVNDDPVLGGSTPQAL